MVEDVTIYETKAMKYSKLRSFLATWYYLGRNERIVIDYNYI